MYSALVLVWYIPYVARGQRSLLNVYNGLGGRGVVSTILTCTIPLSTTITYDGLALLALPKTPWFM